MLTIFTSVATFFQSLTGLLDDLGPGLNSILETDIPGIQQADMERRMRRFKHQCRVNHDNLAGINIRANADFANCGLTLPGQIAAMTASELCVTK